ncbi:thioredoxin-like protein [Podospora conica]|nr:thioredoxin-like protein [Schizothecium conicum]
MFRFKKSLDVIQLFHKTGSPTSTKAADFLKRIAVQASESASEDKANRDPFELQVTEEPPTQDQLQTMLDYAGDKGISSIVEGAKTSSEALRLVKENVDRLRRPITVDWNNGKVYAGAEESEILKMLNALPSKK